MRTALERYGTALAGLALALFFVAAAPNFASGTNLLNVLKETSFLAILSLGFTLALITAELDLSVAEVASLAAVVTGALVHAGQPALLGIGAGLAVGLGAGVLNGVAVTVLKVPSLIATLGTAAIAKGLAFMITGGVAFVGRWPSSFTGLARDTILGVPNVVVWMVAIASAAVFLVKSTRPGSNIVMPSSTAAMA